MYAMNKLYMTLTPTYSPSHVAYIHRIHLRSSRSTPLNPLARLPPLRIHRLLLPFPLLHGPILLHLLLPIISIRPCNFRIFSVRARCIIIIPPFRLLVSCLINFCLGCERLSLAWDWDSDSDSDSDWDWDSDSLVDGERGLFFFLFFFWFFWRPRE